MPLTTLIDARTGETRTFYLDPSFGCKRRQQSDVCATRTQPIWEVRYATARCGPLDQCRKFDDRREAADFIQGRKLRRQRFDLIYHTSGLHNIG